MRRSPQGSLTLAALDPFFVQLLREVGDWADPGEDPAACARLFSPPAAAGEKAVNEDWEELVRPELEAQFRDARDAVRADLARIRPEEQPSPEPLPPDGATPPEPPSPTFRVRIPARNFEAWLSALNQARLALGARFRLEEGDMIERPRSLLDGERAFRIFQVDFYGHLQEMIIRRIEGETDDEGEDASPAAEGT